MKWMLILFLPVLISVFFKFITVSFNVRTILAQRRAKRDSQIISNNVEIAAKQQMAKFAAENNYYEKRNERLRQQAIQEAEKKMRKENDYDNKIKDYLQKSLIYLKTSFPKADEELFVKYSYLFFTNDSAALIALEKEIEQSHKKNLMVC